MEYVQFYVGARPQVYWDWHLADKNMRFIRGIDPAYYRHLLDAHLPHLEGESSRQAAAALRIGYAQGLETLFALLCATMQAPACVVGWMQSYKNNELRDMVSAVSSMKGLPVLAAFRPASWATLATHVHSYLPFEEAEKAAVQEGFGQLWAMFARDFLDERLSQEYNALKHGTRPRLGGFYLGIGIQTAKGVPASPEDMHPLGGSDYGSTFFIAERLGNGSLHCRPREVSVNWVPENLENGIDMLAMSIQNVVSFLRILNSDPPAGCSFQAPVEQDAYFSPWARSSGPTSMSMDSEIRAGQIQLWTKDEVLRSLEEDSS